MSAPDFALAQRKDPALQAGLFLGPPNSTAWGVRTADKALFIKTNDGSFIEAASGKPAPDIMSSGLRQVRMNNAVRGEVEAALGSLRMFAPDAATRFDAAEAPFLRLLSSCSGRLEGVGALRHGPAPSG